MVSISSPRPLRGLGMVEWSWLNSFGDWVLLMTPVVIARWNPGAGGKGRPWSSRRLPVVGSERALVSLRHERAT